MSKSESYFSCLDIDVSRMDQVFEDDHKFWLQNLQKTKDEVTDKGLQLKSLLSTQEVQLKQFLTPSIPTNDLATVPLVTRTPANKPVSAISA